MLYKSIYYKIAMTTFIAFYFLIGNAQNNIDCQKIGKILPTIERKTNKISTTNPELISLHYLFVKDMQDDLAKFQKEYIPQLHLCRDIDFYATLRKCDSIRQRLDYLEDTLEILRHKVDAIFYEKAVEELHHDDTAMCMYLLDRSIQFNNLQTDALILKLKLLFAEQKYDECINIIHLLYNEVPLQRQHENDLSDFTSMFYDRLFTLGDSLIKIEHATEALSIFETLETFCHDMPTAYCNDDYYYGIIRSKTGVYESYLTIAKVAWEKKNDEIAYKFLDYAEQYLAENQDNVTLNENFAIFKKRLIEQRANANNPTTTKTAQQTTASSKSTPQNSKKETVASKPTTPPKKEIQKDKARQAEYDQLLKDALRLCKNDGFDEAWIKLKRARAIENCNCIEPDFRVQVLYDELAKYYK